MNQYWYSKKKYPFINLIEELFHTDELRLLHENLAQTYMTSDGLAGLGNDTHSFYHKLFYDKLNSGWEEFNEIYTDFIREIIFQLFSEEESLIYQTTPSFRIQYPNSKAVTTIHCDSDKNHKHPLGEINILIPLTNMTNTSTIWIESLPNMADWKPINLTSDEFIVWNGNRCRHFNKVNKTGETRISMDFRILPKICYDPTYNELTATTKQRFIIGEYYSEMQEI